VLTADGTGKLDVAHRAWFNISHVGRRDNRILAQGGAGLIENPGNVCIFSRMTNPGEPRGSIKTPEQMRTLHAFGEEITFHMTGAETGGKWALWTEITPPRGGPPPHTHANEDELFFVLEGRVGFYQQGQWTEVGPGASVFMPRNSVHTFKNLGTSPSKMLIQTQPAGFDTFMARCAEEFSKPGGPDMQRILQISAEHGIQFVTG
jgi:quercetin dioxygenase-like cupin family protein